ncbi:hypothetical protein Ahy_A07g032690 [Arachis hypogaea]|uniref:Uncharacterized protein n=1 Tax=Arachis hypogaea TaxID=3818 RepID=A0A445C7B0_ARAHY|nr:hypothetical protein Ahy_A07g032690 [Arachis hypogaea]
MFADLEDQLTCMRQFPDDQQHSKELLQHNISSCQIRSFTVFCGEIKLRPQRGGGDGDGKRKKERHVVRFGCHVITLMNFSLPRTLPSLYPLTQSASHPHLYQSPTPFFFTSLPHSSKVPRFHLRAPYLREGEAEGDRELANRRSKPRGRSSSPSKGRRRRVSVAGSPSNKAKVEHSSSTPTSNQSSRRARLQRPSCRTTSPSPAKTQNETELCLRQRKNKVMELLDLRNCCCVECVLFLGVNQQPLILGDNHKLQNMARSSERLHVLTNSSQMMYNQNPIISMDEFPSKRPTSNEVPNERTPEVGGENVESVVRSSTDSGALTKPPPHPRSKKRKVDMTNVGATSGATPTNPAPSNVDTDEEDGKDEANKDV